MVAPGAYFRYYMNTYDYENKLFSIDPRLKRHTKRVRTFKKQFGVSVMDYLLYLRITKAKDLLRFSKNEFRRYRSESRDR